MSDTLSRRIERSERLGSIVGGIFVIALIAFAIALSGAGVGLFSRAFGFDGVEVIGFQVAVAGIAASLVAFGLMTVTFFVGLLAWVR